VKPVNVGFHLWISVGASTERKSSLFLSFFICVWYSFPVQTDLGLSWVKTREISLNLSIGVEFDAPGIFMLPEFPQIGRFSFHPKRENAPFLTLFFPFYAFAATWLELAPAEGFLLGPWSQSFESRKVCLKFGHGVET